MGESKIITKPNGELFNPDLAQRAITFINMLKHTKGGWHGKNFDLLPWQTQIISDVFGTVKPNGYRQYNTAYVEIPKKQGKSELAAAVALYLLAGDGEWGAEVYGCAADRQQASIVFDVACQMVEQCPALKKRIKPIISQKRLVYLPLNSFYQCFRQSLIPNTDSTFTASYSMSYTHSRTEHYTMLCYTAPVTHESNRFSS